MRKLQHLFFMLLALGVLAACGEDEPAPIEDEDPEVTKFVLNAPSNTSTLGKVFLAGEFGDIEVTEGNWNVPGSNTDLEMTHEGNGVYTFEFDKIIEESFKFKFFLVPTGTESTFDHSESTDCIDNGAGDRTFNPEADNLEYEFEVAFWQGFCD